MGSCLKAIAGKITVHRALPTDRQTAVDNSAKPPSGKVVHNAPTSDKVGHPVKRKQRNLLIYQCKTALSTDFAGLLFHRPFKFVFNY
jgi:hypothetical protein